MRIVTSTAKTALAAALALGILGATAGGAAAIEPLDNPIIFYGIEPMDDPVGPLAWRDRPVSSP